MHPLTGTLGVPTVPAICRIVHEEKEHPALVHVVPATHEMIRLVSGAAVFSCTMPVCPPATVGIVAMTAVRIAVDADPIADEAEELRLHKTEANALWKKSKRKKKTQVMKESKGKTHVLQESRLLLA